MNIDELSASSGALSAHCKPGRIHLILEYVKGMFMITGLQCSLGLLCLLRLTGQRRSHMSNAIVTNMGLVCMSYARNRGIVILRVRKLVCSVPCILASIYYIYELSLK